MFQIRSIKQLSAAILATGSLALALGAHAEEGPKSATCESARLSAWFERQRQLTDGDTNPFQQTMTPRECAATYGSTAKNDAAPDKERVAEANAPRKNLRWDFEGRLAGE